MCYQSGIKKIAKAYEGEFARYGEDFFRMIAEFQSIRNVLLSLYSILITEGKCTPIENLELEEKASLWAEAKRFTKSEKVAVETARAIHAFGTFIQLGHD